MLFEEIESKSSLTNKLENQELDKLLENSSLFPSLDGEPGSHRSKEAEAIIKAKCNLYKINDAGGEFKLKVPPIIPPKKKKKTQDDTAGPKWFNMKAPIMTPEIQQDLEAIRLRRHLDPKHHYKRNDIKELPKFFQIGTVISAPDEPKSQKIDKEKRRKPLVEQLLAQDNELKFSKKKWEQVMKSKPKKHKKSHGSKSYKKKKLGFK
mmetsp:Transcript_29185/g.28920  ORF Transcript_29185/g.28920 Transcript_29185/m.28920 type:complete len:207 (+) Transcript_29185:21-641(+)